jgi:RHS repeat-associated protein
MWQMRMTSGSQQWLQSKHIFVGEGRIATKSNYEEEDGETDGNLGFELGHSYWYHGDHLGSAQMVTNAGGKQHERIEYTPYGELWIEHKYEVDEGALPYRFTGKELDSETGFYYYGARYLDPKTSRWISGDPALGEYIPGAPVNDEVRKQNGNLPGGGGIFNLVNLHVYHYAGNNPVRYTDPDGNDSQVAQEILGSPVTTPPPSNLVPSLMAGVAKFGPFAIILVFILLLQGDSIPSNSDHGGVDKTASSTDASSENNVETAPGGSGKIPPPPTGGSTVNAPEENPRKLNPRQINEAKRAFEQNKEFREFVHREYKPSEKSQTFDRHNPNLSDDQIGEAYQEWKGYNNIE